MTAEDSLIRQLELARRDLLDLSTANRLLNTPRDAARGSSVEIKDEVSAEVFRMLVSEKKQMHFEQGVEAEETDGRKRRTTKKRSSSKQSESADRTTDALLHTELEPEELDERLMSLVSDSTASFEEKGINVLFLAMGMLRWYDADEADKPRDAPLLLIPVTLVRDKGGSRYTLKYTGDEIETNLTLQIRLKIDFGIDLPTVPDTEDLSPVVYFKEVSEAIAGQKTWEVLADDMLLWFFSFTKLLMYRDLDPETWTGSKRLEERPLIRQLLQDGFPPVEPLCGEGDIIDPLFEPSQTAHVIDCDSSQSLVIEEACRGRSLVIQGPPGTGKSQTITNLIAAAVQSGKTILFVAEKMAALEVVKRRLDNIGIGDMCLELHSNKANKRAVLEEIDRTLKLGSPILPGELSDTVKQLKRRRDELNAHVDNLHTPLRPSERSPYEVLSELIDLRADDVRLPDFQLEEAAAWTKEEFERNFEAVSELSEVIENIGSPEEHPWRGSELDQILPLDLERLLVAAPREIESLDALTKSASGLATRLNDDPPASLAGVGRLLRTALALLAAPELDAQAFRGTVWRDHRAAIKALADSARSILLAKDKLKDRVSDAAWDTDVAEARQAYSLYGESFFRMFRSSYRNARRLLKGLLTGPQPDAFADRMEILELLYGYQKAKKDLGESDTLGEQAFGRFWLGVKTDWRRLVDWESWDTQTAADDTSRRFREMPALLEDSAGVEASVGETAAKLDDFLDGFARLCEALKIDCSVAFSEHSSNRTAAKQTPSDGQTAQSIERPEEEETPDANAPAKDLDARLQKLAPADRTSLVDLRRRMVAWGENPEGLQHWQTYRRSRAAIATIGDGVLVQGLNSGKMPAAQAPRIFRFACAEAILRDMLKQLPGLESFDAARYEDIVGEFCDLDIRRLELARAEVAAAHWSGIGRRREENMADAVALLKHEMQKKRRHLPLRQLLSRAGAAIQAVKPVFMMSPLSVAQFLEAGGLEFDMLLIDEASQVRPVEALGAAARCRQMICVGDDKQMPPTQFFGVVVGDVQLDDGDSPAMQAGDVESVLGLCIARNMPQRMLRWHYRSKHESLIAVSNKEFYESQLYVIPSPERSGELGVKWHFVEGGRFIKGKNAIEAKVVAEAIMRHALERPDWTLGVGAFSVSQRDAILKELETLRRDHPKQEAFFDPNAPDPFFVKNLENIQGDERDVIFVSVGYGPGEDGKVSMNFGPVSSSGGERRLNVLMTRAKRVCEIFSSMHAEDIDTTRATGRGPAVFREYLKFAQLSDQGIDPLESSDDHDPAKKSGDHLVRVLRRELIERGYEVESHVGIAGVFVDLAVVDPDNPDRYLLGIDVDGDSYRAARSARDRDRTRMGVLVGQGWSMYRIWSLEFFRRPTEQLNALIEQIEAARSGRTKKSGPRLASTVSSVNRQTGGPDPLSTAVSDMEPVPPRSAREIEADQEDDAFSVSDVLGTAIKVGGAVLTAKEGKGLDAAIRVLTGKNEQQRGGSKNR
ncbi:MAG: DUF4011 domain-containing protein [Pirellulaceae bacterium]